jgi:phosphohistidine phosphatase SixA
MRRRIFAVIATTVLLARGASAQPSTVILVRHAEKASQTDTNPDLSPAGMQRARALMTAIADAGVTTVITTQYVRTKQTAAPVAEVRNLKPIVVVNGGNVATHIVEVAAVIKSRAPSDVVLVVGHSNTIPAIIGALGGPKLPNLCDSQYSTIFILEMSGPKPPRLIRATYGVADPVDPTCATMKVP